MQLYCEKYRESLVGTRVVCRHPKEYCKFRSACLAHFMGKEEKSDHQGERACATLDDDQQNVASEKRER